MCEMSEMRVHERAGGSCELRWLQTTAQVSERRLRGPHEILKSELVGAGCDIPQLTRTIGLQGHTQAVAPGLFRTSGSGRVVPQAIGACFPRQLLTL